MATEFQTWLEAQELQMAIVVLPQDEDITIEIPDEEQVVGTHTIKAGSKETTITGKELSITIKHASIINIDTVLGFNDQEEAVLMQLVKAGYIVPRYERDESGRLCQIRDDLASIPFH